MSKDILIKHINNLYENDLARPNKDRPTDDELFTALCVKYMVLDKDTELTRRVFDNHNSDGTKDGGIDFWYFEENEDSNDLFHIIQGKHWSSPLSDKQIKAEFDQAKDTIDKILNNEKPNIRPKFRNNIAKFVCREDLDFHWHFFQAQDLSDDDKKKIEAYIKAKGFAVHVNGSSDVIKAIEEREKVKEYVDHFNLEIEGKQQLRAPKGIREDTDAIIVNAKSSSLKNMMQKHYYDNSGLFSQNLREYIKNTSIDDPIQKTIQKSPDDFWLYNNGVIICCEDFSFDNENVKLKNFSVINGAQTMNRIWETDGKHGFFVTCKIIQSKDSAFKTNIALFSNSQKAIKQRDFYANDPRQIKLQEQLANRTIRIKNNNGKGHTEKSIFCEIKRGLKPSKGQYKLTNQTVGQLIWSFNHQNPGKARSEPAKMWVNVPEGKNLDTGKRKKSIYELIFNDAHVRADEVSDIIQLSKYIEEFKAYQHDRYMDDTDNDDMENMDAFLNNGELFLLAYIGHYKNEFIKQSKPTAFLSDLDDKEIDDMYDVFYDIAEIMTEKAVAKSKTAISNYTKVPANYKECRDKIDSKCKTKKNSTIKQGLDKIFLHAKT